MADNGTASSIVKALLKSLPVEWILPVVVEWILGSIKNYDSKKAKILKPILLKLRDGLDNSPFLNS